jgi:hypothetical protein
MTLGASHVSSTGGNLFRLVSGNAQPPDHRDSSARRSLPPLVRCSLVRNRHCHECRPQARQGLCVTAGAHPDVGSLRDAVCYRGFVATCRAWSWTGGLTNAPPSASNAQVSVRLLLYGRSYKRPRRRAHVHCYHQPHCISGPDEGRSLQPGSQKGQTSAQRRGSDGPLCDRPWWPRRYFQAQVDDDPRQV